ncbi:MAG TPA: AtpZ/AtpI family protein [Dehalococcoidia bacterium]|nr:AtpZ/AtpI family protein [Dehalococcoidia bacterium]
MSGLPPALRLVGIGWYVALCITLGVLGGVWLDSKFDTDPAFTLAGLFLGLSVAFWGGYRMLMDVISAIGVRKGS